MLSMKELTTTFTGHVWIPQGMSVSSSKDSGNYHLNRLSPEYIKGKQVRDHWFKGGLFEWQKQTVRECHGSAFKKRLDGYTLTEMQCWFRYWPWRCCRCQDVSHILIDIQLIPPTAHTWYVMRMGKYTISISEICLCVSVCVCVFMSVYWTMFELMATHASPQ